MELFSEPFKDLILQTINNSVQTAVKEAETQASIKNRYMNKKSASEYAGVSRNTFDGWVSDGLPVFKVGKNYLIDRDDIDRYIQEGKI